MLREPAPDVGLPIIIMGVVIVFTLVAGMLINWHVEQNRCANAGGTLHKQSEAPYAKVQCIVYRGA